MNYYTNQMAGSGWAHTWVIASGYRFLAFAIATAQIFTFSAAYDSVIPPLFLISGVGIYSKSLANNARSTMPTCPRFQLTELVCNSTTTLPYAYNYEFHFNLLTLPV